MAHSKDLASKINDNFCLLCSVNYRDTTHKYRHERTKKHLAKIELFHMKERENQNSKNKQNQSRFHCDGCEKSYKYKSGLSKHKIKCHGIQKQIANPSPMSSNEDMMEIMKNILKTQMNILEENITKQTTNTNNVFNNQGVYINKQVVNVNVFLNEKCNNAISLIDFINNLNLTLDDLKETKTLGYVDGVSNILVKKLVSLKPTERPIHCDEINHEEYEFYVKEDSNWMKDIGNKRIDWSIENISKKQIEMLKQWEQAHPLWMNSDKETETYLELVKMCMGGSSQKEFEHNKKEIKKALANGVKINDIFQLNDTTQN